MQEYIPIVLGVFYLVYFVYNICTGLFCISVRLQYLGEKMLHSFPFPLPNPRGIRKGN